MMNQAFNYMSHRSVFKKHVYRMNWMGISWWYGMRYTALSKNLLEIKNSQAFATGTALAVSVLFWHFFQYFLGTFGDFLGLVKIFVWLLVHQNLTLSGICHWHCPRRLCPWLNHVDCLLQSPGITYTYIIYILCYLSLSYLTCILCYLYLSYLTYILCYLYLFLSYTSIIRPWHLSKVSSLEVSLLWYTDTHCIIIFEIAEWLVSWKSSWLFSLKHFYAEHNHHASIATRNDPWVRNHLGWRSRHGTRLQQW